MSVAHGTPPDLPGYGARTFTLMPVGFTSQRSVQVSGFTDIGLLTPLPRLISASCSSGQRFAFGFLQIRSRPRHPCRSANTSPCRVCRGFPPPSTCALPGAPKERDSVGCPFVRLGLLLRRQSCLRRRSPTPPNAASAIPSNASIWGSGICWAPHRGSVLPGGHATAPLMRG